MRLVKKILKFLSLILIVPIAYLLVSIICSYITVNKKTNYIENTKTVYLTSNGNHLEIIIAETELGTKFLGEFNSISQEHFVSFGWGGENVLHKSCYFGKFYDP